MSHRWQALNQLQAIWVIDSDRWDSNLRWQFALRLPTVRHHRMSTPVMIESPDRLIELGNELNRPLVMIVELNKANLPAICSLMLRFSQDLSNALLMAVGDRDLEIWSPLIRFSGIVDFYSQEADLKRMMQKILLFQSSSHALKSRDIDKNETQKTITGLANQIKDQLRSIF